MEWLTPELLSTALAGAGLLGLVALTVLKVLTDYTPRRAAEEYLREALEDARQRISDLSKEMHALRGEMRSLREDLHMTQEDQRQWHERALALGWRESAGAEDVLDGIADDT